MKTLAYVVQKGGTGKSMFATQTAFYAALKLNLRVLVIDLDHQGNVSGTLELSDHASAHPLPASALFEQNKAFERIDSNITVIVADAGPLRDMESQPDMHGHFATYFRDNLLSMASDYDLCIIDVNPNPDIRQISALLVATHVVAPIQATRESIDGVAAFLTDTGVGFQRIQATHNPGIQLIGLLPNLCDEQTTLHRDVLAELFKANHSIMMRHAPDENGNRAMALVKRYAGLSFAQSKGLPVWDVKTDSGKAAASALESVLSTVMIEMELTT